ncbi:MAG TPA: HD domain-containing protein [Alphaproteobacteria bacterium]
MDPVETLLELYETKGKAQYGREAVSQTEHALQSAALAEAEACTPALVAAALLHDVGHLLAKRNPGANEDDRHEDIGWGFLKSLFGEAVAEPVRLHVPAKRYLCAVEPDYFSILSPASVRSLELQGGRFTAPEAEQFRQNPFAADAVWLRRWDDQAKAPGTRTKSLRDYAALLRSLSA